MPVEEFNKPCRNCYMALDKHAAMPKYLEAWCDIEHSGKFSSFEPMDNLDYVEWVAKQKGI